MNIEICISTLEEKIYKIPHNLTNISPDISITIIHQRKDGSQYDYPGLLSKIPNKTAIIESNTKGLALSRNIGLRASTADIYLPTDDDVTFPANIASILSSAFKENPSAHIITFQSALTNTKFRKKYSINSFKHNIFSINRVSSIEIALRPAALARNEVAWDELFGIGQEFPGGLEMGFLHNALSKQLKILYIPSLICFHPDESTGARFDQKSARTRGALFRKLYGSFGPAYSLLFTVKHFLKIRQRSSTKEYFLTMLKGSREYSLITKNKNQP